MRLVMSEPLPTVLDATFVAEARTAAALPPAGPPEVAIAGRSNVGKSTLLNSLASRRALARTSKTPGRTRGLLFYRLALRLPDGAPLEMRLVDLPGYGYAQVSHDERKSWQKLVEGYVEGRATLRLFVVLVDARRGIEEEERQLLEWLRSLGTPYHVVVTKSDKLRASERGSLRDRTRAALGQGGPPVSLVSGQTGDGMPELWRAIARAVVD
jgi:GTP-binding protein